MRQLGIFVLALFVAGTASSALGQIYTDDMSSGANWTIVQDPDASAVFGFDYSTKGVPPAPNGSDTIGLKFEVNNNAPADSSSIVAVNSNTAYTGEFTYRVDIWSNWAPVGGGVGTGTTEFIGVNVGHDAVGIDSNGASFIYTGDGDASSTDYRLFKALDQLQSESGQYTAGTEAGARNNSHPHYTSAFPSVNIATAVPTQGTAGTVAAGAGGFQWMTLNVEVDTDSIGPSGITANPGFARISMRSDSSGNTIEIGTIDNSNDDTLFPATLGGSIGVVMSDLFSSVTVNSAFSFGIFDNVQVLDGLVPLPSDGLPGDFDSSGIVDGTDFLLWQRNQSVGSLSEWQTNFGTGTPLLAAAAVPEPSSALLFLMVGMAAILVRQEAVRARR